MNKSRWIILLSYIFQTFFGLWNTMIIFIDGFPSVGEQGVIVGLIFLVHGLAIYLYFKNKLWRSYLGIVLGYLTATLILSYQDEIPNWFATGVGGIGLEDSLVAFIWPAILSLSTLIALQRTATQQRPFLSLKKVAVALPLIWISAVLIEVIAAPSLFNDDPSFLDVLLNPLLTFLFITWVGGMVIGPVIFLILSFYLRQIRR